MTEHQYWRSCLKLKKILFNDMENEKIINYPFDESAYETKYQNFILALNVKAEQLLDNSGL